MPTFRFDRKADYNQPYFDMDDNFIHPCCVCGGGQEPHSSRCEPA